MQCNIGHCAKDTVKYHEDSGSQRPSTSAHVFLGHGEKVGIAEVGRLLRREPCTPQRERRVLWVLRCCRQHMANLPGSGSEKELCRSPRRQTMLRGAEPNESL
ncbi:hypothetical protein GN956_G12507 [Arapaima gigas]